MFHVKQGETKMCIDPKDLAQSLDDDVNFDWKN